MSDKKKYRGTTLQPCEEHGFHARPVTFTYDDDDTSAGETVFEERSATMGYSRRYAEEWDRVFGRSDDDDTVN